MIGSVVVPVCGASQHLHAPTTSSSPPPASGMRGWEGGLAGWLAGVLTSRRKRGRCLEFHVCFIWFSRTALAPRALEIWQYIVGAAPRVWSNREIDVAVGVRALHFVVLP